MATTQVPSPSFTDTGFTAPSSADVLAGTQADLNNAFGGNLSQNQETPQGQLSASMAAMIAATNDLFCLITNQVDPAYASGRMQDAIGRIYFIERQSAQPTTVAAQIVGARGTVITTGALAQAQDGNIYQSLETGTIGTSGTITLQFACITTGPIECAANTLTSVLTAIPGWDAITNPAPGVLGRDVESRQDFEIRRAASVAVNAIGTLPAVRASVLNVSGVTDAYVVDNPSASPATIGGVTIAAHTLYVAAVGGTDLDVATAIWKKKNPGCGYTGTTTVTVKDSNSGYQTPLPSYSVTFTRPSPLTIAFDVELAAGDDVPSDAAQQVQAAIISAFNGQDGGDRARIGSTIYASRYYAAVAALGSWVRIVSITVNSANDVTANINQVPVTSDGDITVNVS